MDSTRGRRSLLAAVVPGKWLGVWLMLAAVAMAQEKAAGETQPVYMDDQPILLPKEIVRGDRLPLPAARDLYDPEAFRLSLVKKYPGLSVRGQPPEVDNYAVLQDRDERRLAAMGHFKDLAQVIRVSGDSAEAAALDLEINRAFLRRPTWREDAMDRNINRCR